MASKETIVIETEARFTDNASAGLKVAGQQVDKFKTKVDGATKASEKLGGTKVNPKIGAPADKATPVFKKVLGTGRSFAGKTFRAAVDIDDKATSKLKSIKDKVFSLKTAIGGVLTGVAAKKVIIDPISVADSTTTAQIGFETMLGSKKKADKFMADIKNFAVETPFETQDVVQNSQKMLAMGWNRKNILTDMNRIGNVSAATGTGAEGIERITTALGQMQMKGKVSAEEMLQLTEANVKAWDYVAKGEGVSVAQAQDMVTKGLIPVDDAINSILKGMDEFDGMMDKTANRTASGLKSQIADTFQIGFVEKWGRGLQTGAVKGMSKLLDYLDEMSPKMDKWGDVLEDIGEDLSMGLVSKLESAGNKLDELVNRDDFQNASIGGKISIAWDELISNPFSEWWDSTGKPAIVSKLKSIGTEAAKSIKDIFKNSLKDLMPGGDKAGIEDYILGYLGIKGGLKLFGKGKNLLDMIFGSGSGSNPLSGTGVGTMTVSAATVYVNGGVSGGSPTGMPGNGTGGTPQLPGTEAGGNSSPKRVKGGLFGLGGKGVTLKSGETVAATGAKAWFGNLGVKLGSGAATAGGAAAVGAAGVAGIAGIAAGVGSAAKNIYNAVTSKNKEEKKKEGYRGGTKLGMVGAGAATGAAIGSVVPVVGTAAGALIGGGAGGIAALLKGNDAGDYIRNRVDKLQDNKKRSSRSYSYDIDAIQGKAAKGTDDKLSDSTKKAARETKSYTKESETASKTVKSYGATTSGAASKVSGLGSYSSTAGGNVGTMGGQALTAGGNVQALGSQATLVASVLSAAANTIRSAASQAKAAASSASSSSNRSSAPNTRLATPPTVQKNARGNYIGRHIISELGEEGPEMVIPLSKHRSRALGLWEQAGEILGVTHYARGGKVGNVGRRRSAGAGSVQINVASGAIQITVQAASGAGGDVVAAIKNSKQEIADVIMNAIVDACGTSYTNRTAEVM
ncbi:tape measure protein [Eubacterium sp. An3]|uniref:tape measure protein n=1 Tax=Eubacterium sp. An3 TaxID=1965628 RepID=UPI000B54FDAB|nr:hypothetical protein B5F87_15760 [Eubacterium sp. An3]